MTIVDRTRSTSAARPATPSPVVPPPRRSAAVLPPGLVSGAWREGDPVGHRRFASVGDVALERGGAIPDVTVAYETWGRLNDRADNAVLVEHALTGDSHVVGPADEAHPSPGWWDGLIGPGNPSTRTAGSSSPPTCSVAARGPPGRRRSPETVGGGGAASRS